MKKVIQLLLVLFMMFGLVACGEDKPPHEHSYVSGFQSDESYHWKKCDCGEIGEKEEHNFTEWKYVTEDESGKYEERTCVECNYIDTRITTCEHDFQLITVPSTCTEEGYMMSKCNKCGFVNNNNPLPLENHKFGSWIITKEPTCEEDGTQYRVCETCQLKEEEKIEAKDHNVVKEFKHDSKKHWIECTNCDKKFNEEDHTFSDWITISEDENGKKQERVCTSCEYKETRIEGCEHNYVKETEPSTCKDKGFEKTECSKCGNISEYKELPLEEHKFGEWEITKKPSCTSEGEKVRVCEGCKKEEKQALPKENHNHSIDYKFDSTNHWRECACGNKIDNAAHNFSSWKIVSEDANGKKEERVCETCKYKETKVSDCEHNYVDEKQESTCTVKGYEKSTCSKCGHIKENKELPLADHTYGEWVVIKESTCKEEGTKEKTCSVCGHKEHDSLPKSSHDNEILITKKPTCSEEGTATTKCKVCGQSSDEKIDKIDHTFGAGEVIKESTCKDHGQEERTCLVCGYKELFDMELTDHSYGDWQIHKQPTLEEEGIERNYCTVCGAYEEYVLDKLPGFTITVSGGTVNRKGENKDQSTIYVAEGEILEIVAKNYSGYTFYQWFSDGEEIIPTSSFELYVTRNAYFFICFEEGLDYGSWVHEQEVSCTQDGLYSRTDSVTGLKQYMVILSRGHEMSYEAEVEHEPTCTEKGKGYYECYVCGYKEYEDLSPLGHNFNGEEVVIEEAYGAKIGVKEISCTRCDEKTTKNYMKALYPTGNIKIVYSWNNQAYVSTADRDEVHYKLGENKYGFEIKRDTEDYRFYFYYENLGKDSPVYVKKTASNPSNNKYCYDWSIITYVDSYDEFIKYLDNESKGNDNGRNNSSLFMLYEMWQEEFNRTGAIPNGYYCSAVVEHQGYTCRVYENEHHAYYVTEDNCVLYYSEKYPGRNFAYVSSITEITEIPYDITDIGSKLRVPIDIERGSDGKFIDQSHFQVEKLNQIIEIYEDKYISKRKTCVGYEVENHNGEWIKITELVDKGSYWESPNDQFTYKSIVDNYLDGINPEVLKIRAILVDADMPVHVTVKNGHLESTNDSTNYGSDNVFPANDEVLAAPDYDESKYTVDYIIVTINGVTTEIREDYIYYYTLELPASGEVTVEFVTKEFGAESSEKLDVTINVIGGGTVNKQTGKYSIDSELELIASANKGYIFSGWYVKGLYNYGGGEDIPMMLSSEEELDYYQYGEYFGNKPIKSFLLSNPYEDIVITAIFEKISVEKDYIDITITDGFFSNYKPTLLHVSALRLKEPDYYDIHGTFDENQNIIGWQVTEQLEDGPSVSELEGEWNGYYFSYDSNVKPMTN